MFSGAILRGGLPWHIQCFPRFMAENSTGPDLLFSLEVSVFSKPTAPSHSYLRKIRLSVQRFWARRLNFHYTSIINYGVAFAHPFEKIRA
jgi:hypothetical protein